MATTTYTPIQTYTLGSAQASVNFNSFSGYTDLVLIADAGEPAGGYLKLQFNGDTGTNYSRSILYGNGSTVTATNASNVSSIFINCGAASGNGNAIINIQNYASTNSFKSVITRNNSLTDGLVMSNVGSWRNSTDAITSITLTGGGGNIAAGSTFTLYGIANAAIGAPKATGGIITYDNTYYYHTFGASGTFTPQQSLTADILVVAGGGGGGARRGGGGGAGGLLGFASQSLSATGYTVTVGAGGGGGVDGGTPNGAKGGDSQFGALTLVVGGGGATGDGSGTVSTINGGSGGGSTGAYSGGTATSGQGNTGGAGSGSAPNYGAGGGGGAGAAGTAGTSTVGGNGGAGVSTYSSYGLITGTGQNVSGTVYYAGGGGGAVYDTGGTSGTGGLGGGGAAGAGGGNNAGIAGLPNTGGGGGGSSILSTGNASAGNGGSGVVIIRYLKA